MTQEVCVFDGKVNVALKGKICLDEATRMREKLFPYVEKGYTLFIFNLTEVEYIDSSGLGVLVAIQKKAKENGGGVVIKGLQGDVKTKFEHSHLTKIFEIHF